MIVLRVVRQAVCVICEQSWILEPLEKPPEKCIHCGSESWEFGPDSETVRRIRKGLVKPKSLNPGATSRKRQQHGKNQYRQFKPRPQDVVENAGPESDT